MYTKRRNKYIYKYNTAYFLFQADSAVDLGLFEDGPAVGSGAIEVAIFDAAAYFHVIGGCKILSPCYIIIVLLPEVSK